MNTESPGVERRSQIDTEVVRGLLLANGGGAVALLAFLPVAFDKKVLYPLAVPIVVALFLFQLGIVAAVIHNHLRRRCSLVHDHYKFRPPAGTLLGIPLKEPRVCFLSRSFMWLSLLLFLLGGFTIFYKAIETARSLDASQELSIVEKPGREYAS